MSKPDTPDDGGQSVTDSEAAAEAEQPETQAASPTVRPRARGAYLLSSFALVCAIAAIGAAGYLWSQYRVFSADLGRADADTVVWIQELRATLADLEDELAGIAADNAETRGAASSLGERLDAIPGRLLDIEQSLAATQGISIDARRRWLYAEAEYYLTVANAELNLAGRWESAESALVLADQKLLELADPGLAGVREQISGELQALRSVNLPDIEGHSFSLSRLAEAGRDLPMRAAAPGVFTSGGEAPGEETSGLARVWQSLKNAIAGMVRVERRADPVDRNLSAEEQAFVRQQLELELGLARFALVRGQTELFSQSLTAAIALLERHFDTTEVAVESSMALLAEMVDLEIAPIRPDISGSLTLLRSLANREN
jgi:uroporphyrin-3 C-methyltransferase